MKTLQKYMASFILVTLMSVNLTFAQVDVVLSADFKTVSDEDIEFSEIEPDLYVINDSVAFDEDVVITAQALSANATVEYVQHAMPIAGKSDTTIIKVTSEDETVSTLYKVVVARSVFYCKIGFLESGNGAVPTGWSSAGANFASSSKGHGGLYPGDNGMRIYYSDAKGVGSITTAEFSSVSTLTFAAKFSKSDSTESLTVQKSTDGGTTWDSVRTYTPAGGEIPSYSTEDAADTLATQTLEIDEENVMICFQFAGAATTPRTMIDDIACKSDASAPVITHFTVFFSVCDISNNPLEGVIISLGDEQLTTNSLGYAIFDSLNAAIASPYTISKGDDSLSGVINITENITLKRTLLTEKIDLFLALGQSNMAGRAPITDYVSGELNNVNLLNDENVWVSASNPMNLYSNIRKDIDVQKVGPSYAFAQTLAKYTDNRIGMVVNARGATNLTAFAGDPYFTPIVQRIQVAKTYGNIKGVIWHQGESNSSNASAYMGLLAPFVRDLRSDIGDDVYFLAAQLGPWDRDGTTEPKYGEINDTLAQISSYVSNSDYAKNDNLSDIGDNTHLNTKSQILLGQRYAQKMLKQVYSKDITILELSIDGEGVVVQGNDTNTVTTAYSYTALPSESFDLKVDAGKGKEFVSLQINGIAITAATGNSDYEFTQIMTVDTLLNIQMTLKDTGTILSLPDDPTDLVAIAKSSLANVLVYPNPASDHIQIKSDMMDVEVSILDVSGRLLVHAINKTLINIKSLNDGTYVLVLKAGDQQLVQKLIVLSSK